MQRTGHVPYKSLAALILVNCLYFFFLTIDVMEGVFGLWLLVLFISVTPILMKDRRNMIAVIVFLIPFEISKTVIPFFQTVEMGSGMFNSVFDLARLFMLYSFVLWFITDLNSFIPVIKHKISYILLMFIGYYCLSALVISPDTQKGLIETFRYVVYFIFFTMTVNFIKKPVDIELILKIMILIAVILSLEGICEYVFDYRLWIDKGRRASATYLDPNIFARFLDIVLLALIILRLKKRYIIKPQYMDISILICGITLLLTISRQGWVIFFICMFFAAFFFEKKVRNTIIIAQIVFTALAIPVLVMLLNARQQGLELYDIGTRAGLLLGGVLMFLSNPILGVGAGGFQAVMINKYLAFLPWGINSATISHTYVMTVLAELGVVGFGLFCVFLWLVFRQFLKNYRFGDKDVKVYSLITFTSVLVIFIGAQAEGRFFEEPLLWLFLGLGMALERIIDKHEITKNKNPHYS